MNLDRLKQILEVYGSRPEHWPNAERDAVVHFLSQSEDARAHVAEQIALDSLLDELPAGDVSASLTEAVLAKAADHLGLAAHDQRVTGAPQSATGDWWNRFIRGSRGLLADVDTMQWSGPTFAKSASVLGSAAVLGFLVALYGPLAIDNNNLTTSEDEIFVAAFATPDYGMDDFSFDGIEE